MYEKIPLTPEVEKLISEIRKHGNLYVGEVSFQAKENVYYRYDQTILKYKNTAYWLRLLFEKAAKSVGKPYDRNIQSGNFSISFDRAKFKGEPDGNMSFSELIEMGSDSNVPQEILDQAYKVYRNS